MAGTIISIGKFICGSTYDPAGPPQRKKGLFLFPFLLKRLALVSPRAFKALSHDTRLLERLDQTLRQGTIDFRRLYLAGFTVTYYPDNDRVVMGIRYPADQVKYQAVEALLFPGKFGLPLTALEVPDLTEREFINLHRLIIQLGGPQKIKSFTVVEHRRVGSLSTNPDGTVNFAFERSEL